MESNSHYPMSLICPRPVVLYQCVGIDVPCAEIYNNEVNQHTYGSGSRTPLVGMDK